MLANEIDNLSKPLLKEAVVEKTDCRQSDKNCSRTTEWGLALIVASKLRVASRLFSLSNFHRKIRERSRRKTKNQLRKFSWLKRV